MVHPQLVASLHIEQHQVQKKPQCKHEDYARKYSATASFIMSFSIDSELDGRSKRVQRFQLPDNEIPIDLWHQ